MSSRATEYLVGRKRKLESELIMINELLDELKE